MHSAEILLEKSDSCAKCSQAFSMTVRRHHCRGCGCSVCDSCSPFRVIVPWQTEQKKQSKVRVCKVCASPRILSCSSVPTTGGEVIVRGYMLGAKSEPPAVIANGEHCRGVRYLPGERDGVSTLRCSVSAGIGARNTLEIICCYFVMFNP